MRQAIRAIVRYGPPVIRRGLYSVSYDYPMHAQRAARHRHYRSISS